MRPTLSGEMDVELDIHAYDAEAPAVGDIVTVQAPAGVDSARCGTRRAGAQPCGLPVGEYSDLRVIKRVIAGPGDSVAFAPDGVLIRNGDRVREPYVRRCRLPCGLPRPITVPPGHYFLAGDNRSNSSDSRIWGPIRREAIDGKVLLSGAEE